MQLGKWHADLRVPQAADGALQGFSGITRVAKRGPLEICTWQRIVDYQPPRATPDEGWMEFETPDRVLETGVHGRYLEVWDRLAGSTGRRIAVAEKNRSDRAPSARLFVSGNYLMRVRPAIPLGPAFEISFGQFSDDQFSIEASTIPGLTGACIALTISNSGESCAEVVMDSERSAWAILEWEEG
jgi:hypothetical protein